MNRTSPTHLCVLLCISTFLAVLGSTSLPSLATASNGSLVEMAAAQFQTESPNPDPEPEATILYFPMIFMSQPVAFYRSGQTFLTWPESTELQGEVYRVYRSSQPITPDTLSKAIFLAQVGKDSARFYSNRYRDISANVWGPRYSDRLVIETGGSPVSKRWGLLVWTLAPQDFDGQTNGDGYYAITVTPPGGTETFNPYMVAGPVSEAVADPLPIELISPGAYIGEGGHVYIQYMDLRSWNPTFHAPNPTNAYYGLDPADPNLANALQYAYDYVVFAPTLDLCGGSYPSEIPVFFHLHGWRNHTTGPADREEGYPKQDRSCAYGIYPIDVTNTWYFGFARGNDYRLRNEPDAGDVIINYTEQRILRMVYDLARNPPGPAVDPQRIYVAGQSMGGTGALAFAERYPNVFAAAYSSQPMTNFRTAGVTTADWNSDVSIKWGRSDLNLPISSSAPAGWANHLQKYNGTSAWDWQDLSDSASAVRLRSRLWDDMAPLGIAHGSSDTVVLWSSQGQPFYSAFNSGARPWGGRITDHNHQWEYYRGLPPGLADLGTPGLYIFKPFWDLRVIRDETVPGLSNLSTNSPIAPTGAGSHYNQTIKWSSSWDPWDGRPTDEPTRWQISLCSVALGSRNCRTGVWQTVDITPRRVQRFQIVPGKVYTWVNRRASDGEVVQQGSVSADSNGLLTVKGFWVSPEGNRLVIKPR